MNITHILKNGARVESVEGHKLSEEKTKEIAKILEEVIKSEKKDN